MSQTVSKEASKLRKLLTELFQIDDASSLDFGIYRILAQRKDEMRRFLDELMQGIPARLGQEAGDDRAKAQAELDRLVESRLKDGDELEDIHNSKAYKDRLAKLNATVDPQELARDVFRDLYAFFARYWDEGDFMAVPRYDRDTYAIPYDGSEVTLHWANRDQYYVKSTVFFNDMTVRDAAWPGTLRFELAAAVTDRDNAKGADANKRRFTLADEDQPVQVQGKNLVVRLRYGPVAASEGADEGDDEAPKKGRVSRQDTLDEENANRILELAPAEWRRVLERPHADSEQPEILRRLRRYTRGNTADFFIHKNLRKFLRRELDFFIKNEVFDLDNIDRASVSTLENKLKRVRALRGLAHDLIDWLHQIEDFQRRLFLKKKFVLRTDWAVTLDRVPKELWPEIAANEAQVRRWKELYGAGSLEQSQGTFDALIAEGRPEASFLCETRLLSPVLQTQVLGTLRADEVTGELWSGDAHHVLSTLVAKHQPTIDAVVTDPIYNTGEDGFVYRDRLQHSTWLTSAAQVLYGVRGLLVQGGSFWATIDDHEHDRFKLLAAEVFGHDNFVSTIVWQKRTSPDVRATLGSAHDYLDVWSTDRWTFSKIKRQLPPTSERLSDYKNPDGDPRGPWASVDLTGQVGHATASQFEPLTSPDGHRFVVPEGRCWAISQQEFTRLWKDDRIWLGVDGTARPRRKRFLSELEGVPVWSWWSNTEVGTNEEGRRVLIDLGLNTEGQTPKPVRLLERCIKLALPQDHGVVIDTFAGSGTTGHAVLNLNREDGGKRRFILIEMGDHFDTVLVPRILKATYSKDWKEGKPVDRKGLSALYKILRLESYDDTLENITLDRPDERQEALFNRGSTTGAGRDYLLRYSLRMEAGRSLLDKDRFATPFDYKIRALVTRRDEQGNAWSAVDETPVDLVETFNYLLGLRVKAVQPLGRGGDMRRARYIEGVRRNSQGEWAVKVVVIWRDCTQVDDAALDDLFARAQFTEPTPEGRRIIADYDEVYVNGDNRLPNQRLEGERWKVTLIEEEFHRLMFDVPEEE